MPAPDAKRLLSLAAGTVLDAAPAEIAEAAAAAGFGGCGLRLGPDQMSPGARRELHSRIGDSGIRLLDLEVVRLRAGQPADDHRAMLDLAGELGATWVLTVLDLPDRAEQVDRLGRLAEIATDVGVRISLEFMAFTAVRTVTDALALAAAVPRCRVLVDALHLARTGGRPVDVAPHVASLSYAQLCDAAAAPPFDGSPSALADEARHHRLLPGDGELDLAGLVAILPADLPVSVEVQSDAMSAAMTPQERAVAAYRATVGLLG